MNTESEMLEPLPKEVSQQIDKDLQSKLRFLGQLVQMGEEPYEIEFYVSEVANLCSARAFSLFLEHGYTTERIELFASINHFFDFVYLQDHGQRRYTIENASKRLFEEFSNGVTAEPPLEKVSYDDLDFYDALKYGYLALEAAGCEGNLNTRISHIDQLQRKALRKKGIRGPKSFVRGSVGYRRH